MTSKSPKEKEKSIQNEKEKDKEKDKEIVKQKSKEREYKIGKYLIKGTVGRGTFGKVKLGIYIPTNEKVAIKILEKNRIREKDDEIRVQREFEMLTKFNHINLILVAEIFESNESFYTVMEYCEGGELFNYIVRKRKLNEEEASFFFYQIINGLEYIHSLGIVHRDLKPENLLLTKNHILKIIDFGLSNYFDKKNLLSTPCGSPSYASPEMVSGKKYNGFKIDIWSTGIILYAMLCGYLPFEDKDNDLLFKKILECKLEFPHHLSLISRDLIKKILVTNPDKRISIHDIKKHPFFHKGKTIYKQEFSFSYMSRELVLDDDDINYKRVKTEGEKKKKNNDINNNKNNNEKDKENKRNDNDKIKESDIKGNEDNNKIVNDKNNNNNNKNNVKDNKVKEENEKKIKEDKNENKEKNNIIINKENNKISISKDKGNKKSNENKTKIELTKDKNNKKTIDETIPSFDIKVHKSHHTSNNYNIKNIETDLEEIQKIVKTEPNLINLSQKLKNESQRHKSNKLKNKSPNQKPKFKFKSKKPINSTTITHTSYNLSNIGNLETNLNSMRIPINTLIRKHNIITSKRKSNITIKNTVINVNMITTNSIITSFTRKNPVRPFSYNNNHNKISSNNNKSERKKPELKFYDFDSPLTNYTETIVKTQENYPIKSNRKYENEHFNTNYNIKFKNDKYNKHNKFNSMKLGDLYKNNLKENKKNIYSLPYKTLNVKSSSLKHSKKTNSSSIGKNNINVKNIIPKKKNTNMKDLLFKDLLKKYK